MRLAFAITTFEASGEFEPALREWDIKATAQKTFANFRVFIQNEFAKRHKHNKSTAKSVGHGIANTATEDKVEPAELIALGMAEVAHVMQEGQEKQLKQMMELFKTMMNSNSPAAPTPTAPKASNANNSGGQKKKKCPHCNHMVLHKPEKCWESHS